LVTSTTPTAIAQPPTGYTLEAPREIRSQLDQLRKPARQDAAIAALAHSERAGPYLAFEQLAAIDEDHKAALEMAVAAANEERSKRNRKRAARWIGEKRIDLCVEHLIACQDNRSAIEFIDELTPLLHDNGRSAAKELKIGFGGGRPSILLPHPRFRPRDYLHLSGGHVEIRGSHRLDGGVARADKLDSRSYATMGAFVAVRNRLRHPPDDPAEWGNSIVLANCSIPLRATDGSLIISDGNVELDSRMRFTNTIVIARGNITSIRDSTDSFDHVYLAAGGNIGLRASAPRNRSVYSAGGSVTFAGRPVHGWKIREKWNQIGFGLRFFDIDEFGVEVEVLKEGVKVKRLAPWSPLATHEVRAGDVIRPVNGVDVNSPAAFRHELRRAISLEYALFRLERGRERLTRIVFLDGIPTDPTARIAPPPRTVDN
jgi:hypothetical protein